MTFDPTSVEVTCVTLPKDHCVQVPWEYINVCGYSDQFCKNYHIHTYTYYIHILHTHTTYRISDHIVSFWTTFRRDKKNVLHVSFGKAKFFQYVACHMACSSQWKVAAIVTSYTWLSPSIYTFSGFIFQKLFICVRNDIILYIYYKSEMPNWWKSSVPW